MAIKHTRFGFCYQNLQVVSIFIDHYGRHDLHAIYSDYVYSGNKSHDVIVVNREDCEVCYEIKTGSTFQRDITKLRTALVKIHEFLAANPGAKYRLVVSNDYKNNVSNLWNAIQNIQEGARPSERNTHIGELARLTGLNSPEIEQLIRQLDIPPPGPDHTYTASFSSPVQSQLKGALDEFARNNLDVVVASNIFETSTLVLQLCAICELKSGTGENLLEYFRNQVADFYGRASQDAHITNAEVLAKINECKDKLLEFEGLPPSPPLEVTAALEGERL